MTHTDPSTPSLQKTTLIVVPAMLAALLAFWTTSSAYASTDQGTQDKIAELEQRIEQIQNQLRAVARTSTRRSDRVLVLRPNLPPKGGRDPYESH